MSHTTPLTLQLGDACVQLADGYTVVTFPEGHTVHARHDDVAQCGQQETAQALGYLDVEPMNRDHDLVHCLLALWLGRQRSPVLEAVAAHTPCEAAWQEEAAVLAIQSLGQAWGIDFVDLARQYDGCTGASLKESFHHAARGRRRR